MDLSSLSLIYIILEKILYSNNVFLTPQIQVTRLRSPHPTDELWHMESVLIHMDLAQHINCKHPSTSICEKYLASYVVYFSRRDLNFMPFLLWMLVLLPSTTLHTSIFTPTMSGNRGHGCQHSWGRGRGRPTTTLDDQSITTMFNHSIPESISRKVVAMEEEEMCHGLLALWDLHNLLTRQLK